MRNSFYARHKYRFNDPELIDLLYFNFGAPDYLPDSWFNAYFTDDTLSPMEKRNIEIIQELEHFTN